MKKRLIYGLSILAIGGAAASLASIGVQSGILDSVIATDTSAYAFNLSLSKNALDATAISSGKASMVSDSGNATVGLALTGAVSSESGWVNLSAGGSVYNTKAVNSLVSITVVSSASLTLYWCDVSLDPNYLDVEGVSSATLESGTASYSFGTDYPNFFLLKNAGDSEVTITSVSMDYDCVLHEIEFGRYPQTEVTNTDLIATLEAIEDTDKDGYVEHEGIQYLRAFGAGQSVNKYIDGTKTAVTYTEGSNYYFEVEPIVWDVFHDGTIFSEKILDASNYYGTAPEERTIDGASISQVDYKYSDVRAYLNGLDGSGYDVGDYSAAGSSFYSRAFTAYEQGKIFETTVDNSVASTAGSLLDDNANVYACENTLDKIFLLSYSEITNANYGFYPYNTGTSTSSTRARQYTDYSLFVGLASYDINNINDPGYGWWWTRSPYDGLTMAGVTFVNDVGRIYQYSVMSTFGVIPALKLSASL